MSAQDFPTPRASSISPTRAVYRTGKPFFIDKMPNNFRHVGLIHLMLPNARIIDARREPMACCFSNFKQLFAQGQEFTYSIEDIARYYRIYLELMRHWDRVLPGHILRVQHEDVVDDLEGNVRRILDFCGLEFEPHASSSTRPRAACAPRARSRFASRFFGKVSISGRISSPGSRRSKRRSATRLPATATSMKPGRNDPCPCGSGKKYKRCCGLLPAAGSAPARAVPEAEITALIGFINRNDLQAAVDRARMLIQTYPNAGMLWKILGVAQMRQGKDALPVLRRTVELMPQDAEAQANLGAFLCDQGQWAEGLPNLRRALEIQPRHEQALIDAANAMKALGQVRESIDFYQRALRINPRSAEAHNNIGNAQLQLGQCAEAIRAYRLALELRPNDAQIHCNLGNAQRQLGLFDDAIHSSSRAIELDPALSAAHNNLGLALAGLGRRDEAVASYRQALKLNPDYVEALNNLGSVLPELGQRREARELFARAIELDPERAESYCNLGNLLFEFRRVEDAASSYRRALELEPRNAKAHAGLGAALRMQNQAAEAELSCRAALDIDPNSVAALSLLGELRADRGQFAEAEVFFRRAIEIDPSFPFAYFSIATNRKMTREETAWLAGTEALLATPLPLRHEISLRYALGKYFDDIRQYDDAFGHYARANELSKRYGVPYDAAGLEGRVERIIECFDTATIREPRSLGSASERPVFIVGMPRSGTSLSEQILASHPAIFGAGELSFWHTALAAYDTRASAAMPRQNCYPAWPTTISAPGGLVRRCATSSRQNA